MTTQYSFGGNEPFNFNNRPQRKNKKKNSQPDVFNPDNLDIDISKVQELQQGKDDGLSFTYSASSASSSQAGESTDSSITDSRLSGVLREDTSVLHSHQPHQVRNSLHQRMGSAREIETVGSSVADSMTYSEDGGYYSHSEQPGQSSNGFGHDGGASITFTQATEDYNAQNQRKQSKSRNNEILGSPKGVAAAASPPPRHKRVVSDPGTEVWYAKWWMCGFTDALNLNSKC